MDHIISINTRQLLPGILPITIVITLWCIYTLETPGNRPVPQYSRAMGRLEVTEATWEGGVALNCTAVVQGDPQTMEEAQLLALNRDYRRKALVPDEYYINATQDCRHFTLTRGYSTWALQEEKDFPLAYSIVAHHKVQNFERLLRAVYAPQNVYCVHVDKKAKASVVAAITGVASCFPNVFMVSRVESVVYAGWSRVQADINCMSDLLNVSTEWKYLINLCGQDFPLKTNLEMVRSLRALAGANDMESSHIPGRKKWRVATVHGPVNGQIQPMGKAKGPAPFQLPVMAGSAYMIASRGYIHSALTNSRARELIEWSKDTYSPDEVLWATLQRMPGIPGSTPANATDDVGNMASMARLVMWVGTEHATCHGHFVRDVCVFGVADLPWIVKHHHLFANKFDMDADPVSVRCLEEYLRGKRLAEC